MVRKDGVKKGLGTKRKEGEWASQPEGDGEERRVAVRNGRWRPKLNE